MRIAIDCHTLEIENWAGKEQVLFNILKSLATVDKSNQYILYFRNTVALSIEKPDNWRVKSFRLPTPLWQLAVLFDLFFISKAEVLFVPCSYLLPAIKIFIPTVVMLHDLTTFLPIIKDSHKKDVIFKEKLFVRLALKKAKSVVSVSNNTKADCIKYFNISPDKIKVIYPGNKNNLYQIKNSEAINEVLKKYNLPQNFLLFVGTLEPRKNIINIIKAYKDYLLENPYINFPLLLVGKKGWYYKEFFQLVKDLKLEKDVIFTGYLPEEILPCLYSRAEVFVYPSLYEGFGLPVLEAMSCGAPVITSNISSLPEVAGDAAVLVDPNSINEIKLAIKKITSDQLFRNSLKEKGLIQSQKFSWDIFTRELLIIFNAVYNKIL